MIAFFVAVCAANFLWKRERTKNKEAVHLSHPQEIYILLFGQMYFTGLLQFKIQSNSCKKQMTGTHFKKRIRINNTKYGSMFSLLRSTFGY